MIAKETYNAVILDENSVLSHLKTKKDWFKNKTHELLVAVWLRRLLEKWHSKPHCMAFELKDDLKRLVPNFDRNNEEHIAAVLDKHRKEGAHDVFIVKGTRLSNDKEGSAFEIKRLIGSAKNVDEFKNLVIERIANLQKEYGKTQTVLVLIPETTDELIALTAQEQKQLSDQLITAVGQNCPFIAVWLVGRSADGKASFTQHLPIHNRIGAVPLN